MKTLLTYIVLLITFILAAMGIDEIRNTDIFRFDAIAVICETESREIPPQVFTDSQVFKFTIDMLDHCIITDSSNVRRLHRNGVKVYNELSVFSIIGIVLTYMGSVGLVLSLIWTRSYVESE